MKQGVSLAASSRQKKVAPAVNTKKASSSAASNSAAIQQYQAAIQQLHNGAYEKALGAFEKLLLTAPAELRERCKMYIQTCQRQLAKDKLNFSSLEEHYDYAISKLNNGDYEDARELLEGILKKQPEADYAYYGFALLDSMTGRTQDCIQNLTRAIELNPQNRLQARADNDFQSMADDPMFTELLYPEVL